MFNNTEHSISDQDRKKQPYKKEHDSLTQHNKSKNQNFARNWKPYKYLNKYEKRRLQDKESFRDHEKHVRFTLLSILIIIQS